MSIKQFSELRFRGKMSGLNTWLESRPDTAVFNGCSGSISSPVIAELFESVQVPVLVFLENAKRCEIFAQECSSILGSDVTSIFSSRDAIPYNLKSPFGPTTEVRFNALSRLLAGEKRIYIAPAVTLLQKIPPGKTLFNRIIRLKTGDSLSMQDLSGWLTDNGFRREAMADNIGTFSIRGDIFDIYPFMTEQPVRVEFFGDNIESIRIIDVFSQKSRSHIQNVEIFPMSEFHIDDETLSAGINRMNAFCETNRIDPVAVRQLEHTWKTLGEHDGIEWYLHWFELPHATILDYLPRNACIVWNDSLNEKTRLDECYGIYTRHHERTPEPFRPLVSPPEMLLGQSDSVINDLSFFPKIYINTLNTNAPAEFLFNTQEQPSFPSSLEPLFEDIRIRQENGYEINVLCENTGHAERMLEILSERCPDVRVLIAYLEHGYINHESRQVFYSENQLFSRPRHAQTGKRFKSGSPLTGFDELCPGDYVVHVDHGIGRFTGIERIKAFDVQRDCMVLVYQDAAKLFVPIEDFHKVRKYIGKDSDAPALSRLGSGSWDKLKRRTGEAVREMAKELIELYARRQHMEGIKFSPDTVWQKEFEDAFPFEETPDQKSAIEDVKRDMEALKPMDRLVCGDVGFGKTEVALRAAFKAVSSGFQVAVLAPTTILVSQHFQTFRERLAAFPASVGMLCRFISPAEQKKTVEELKSGKVDIVIGTHRLLSADIGFKNLGLLIIDEEQRFGVGHKEKLKHYRYKVDVLSMTATPIPRTLHLSLVGARDLSIINTPPANRLPIETHVMEYHEHVLKEAVENELDRGGQVYVVNNRISSLFTLRDRIEQLVPRARIAVAHGQMDEKELERIMKAFVAGSFDILVSTVIIENGLDIQNVNTILVVRADTMGLSQLYQLRGRVGRSAEQAYAYLFTPPFREINDLSIKRLKALEQFTELGSGFQIAMRDLEIRGAGNILGHKQHGFIEAVGFELYCRLLKEAVDELSGTEIAKSATEVKVDIALEAFIPSEYVPEPAARVSLYQHLAGAQTRDEITEIEASMIDRFGALPVPTSNLLLILRLKILTRSLGANRILFAENKSLVLFFEGPDETVSAGIRRIIGTSSRRFEVVSGEPVTCKTMLVSEKIADRAMEAMGIFETVG